MPRPASTEAKVRLNLEIPERVKERLERVRVMSEADSFTEVIRRALIIYDLLLTITTEEGGKVVVKNAKGEERELMMFK